MTDEIEHTNEEDQLKRQYEEDQLKENQLKEQLESTFNKNSSLRISRYAILILLAGVSIAIYPILKLFIIPIILAATFTTLFFPLYTKLLKLFKNNRPLSSLITCLLLFLCLVIPSYIVMHTVILQLIHFYQFAEPILKDTISRGENSTLFQHIYKFIPISLQGKINGNLFNIFSDSIKSILTISSRLINKTSIGFFGLFSNIIIMFFTMFYFFMDGKILIRKIKFLSPIRDDYEDMIFSRFLLISRATIMGTLIIGLIQGSLGGITLLIFGIKSWLLWGFIMIILSIIPMVGTWMVLLPAGLIQIFSGHIWQGILILILCFTVISNIDNFIRPRIVGKEAKLHDLIIFFSSLGGIAAFGVMGFIVGPVIAALFIAVVDIYSAEFDQQLRQANNR